MTVFILERVPASLRGELTRWMLELKAGVFLGEISAVVRDRLWRSLCGGLKGGSAIQIYSARGEPGYRLEFWGDCSSRTFWDFDGIQLVRVKQERLP